MLLAFLAGAGMVASASTVNVTYQVNMATQIALGNFNTANGDTVLVSGTWDGWSLTNVLSLSSTAGVYTLTLAQTVGSWPNYQFVIAHSSSKVWESSVGNRWFQVPATATNLPVVYFNNVNGVTTNNVTFQVDMSAQAQLGNFTVGDGFVTVASDALNNWDSTTYLLSNVSGTSNYSGTFSVAAMINSTNHYKFVMNNSTWENDGVGDGGAKNRQFVFPGVDTNLPVVFFNNVSNASSMATNSVTFQVDMTAQTALGAFTPGTDSVTVAGSAFDNWLDLTSYVLSNSSNNTNLYTGTFSVASLPGAAVTYKFLIDGATWEGGIYDRSFNAPTNTALTLPVTPFDGVTNLGSIEIAPAASGQTALSWLSGTNTNNRIRVQSTTSLASGSWQDVAGSAGQSNITVSVGTTPTFFRLVGP